VHQPGVQLRLGLAAVAAAIEQPQVLSGDPGLRQLLVAGVAGVQPGQKPGPRRLIWKSITL
jgi:hypothetical protein